MTRIQMRRGTAAAWTTANPTLATGEHGFETDTGAEKIGDGATAWNTLPYGPGRLGIVRTESSSRATANITIGTANTSRFFRVLEGGTISKVRIQIAVQSGNIAVAAYANTGAGLTSAPGTQLATSGSVACPAVGLADVALGSSVAVPAGGWLAIGADNTTVTFAGVTGIGDTTLSAGMQGTHAAFPPSATPTITYGNNRMISLLGVP